jgi:seryl-tRNA synthetase
MLDINLFRETPDVVRQNLERRKDEEKLQWVEEIINLDKDWRKKKQEVEDLRRRRNELTNEIQELKKSGKDASSSISSAKDIPEKIKEAEEVMNLCKDKLDNYLMRMPNIMHESVPYGKDDSENVEIRKWGEVTKFDFEVKSHVEIAEKLGLADFERSAKVSGAGFYYLKGDLALLEQAMLRFAVDKMIQKGYTLVYPPLMIRRKPYEGVTDLAEFGDVLYKIENEDLYLISTSEHPLAAMYMDETLQEDKLPIKLVGISPCFRKEVGSSGIDTKGVFRRHQFNKVEQFVFSRPEDSWKIHEELIKNAEEIFQELEIPYRVVNICTGDLGIVAAKKYDIELWSPRQGKYIETVSGSNCTDYQARRLNIKCGKEGGEKRVLHTLNSTAIATPSRSIVAILENNQQKDGSVKIPKVLVPYMNGKEYLGK